ncbi:MAG: hypothetical protein BGO70_10545 [Bacteroidetes bacterium 43-93]|nr:hypothetical protein [Bacteroidota bacterium]OJW95556.1 MAG: hypothetical protein BGO70_10545 [Bacteroidetes bacterium 43-93]
MKDINMTDRKKIKAAIVNESKTSVERLAARIISLPNDGGFFVKTCVLLIDKANINAVRRLGEELEPGTTKGFLGISATSYTNVNYVEFYSSIRSFKLSKGDRITLVFENNGELMFEFKTESRPNGYLTVNSCFIDDTQLAYMAETKLQYWILTDKHSGISVKGGFECNEHNQQYRSKRGGQILLQNLVKEILLLKSDLKTA